MTHPLQHPEQHLAESVPAQLDAIPQHPDFPAIVDRFGPDTAARVSRYINPDEQLQGFGSGGSESLVMFVQSPTYGRVVRKICSEMLSAVPWNPNGTGVMTPPSTKGSLQVDYLRNLPDDVRPYFPQVHRVGIEHDAAEDGGTVQRLIYDQSMLMGAEVSTFVADVQPTPGVVAHLHREVMRLLAERIHTHRVTPNTNETIQESYLDKIAARLELSRQAAPGTFGSLLDSDRVRINSTDYLNIRGLLTFFSKPQIREMLEPQQHTLVMGDTNTENVMITKPDDLLEAIRTQGVPEFTYDDIGLKFFDPRAIGFRTAGGKTVDDPMYDNKPIHNTLGNYDVIHGEYFDLAVTRTGNTPSVTITNHDNNPYANPYQGMEKYFKYVVDGWGTSTEQYLQRDPNWLLRFAFIMGTHFAAMPPFHFKRDENGVVPENPEAQKRAIAVYCEGIKWLNMARDMILGNRRNLFGVEVGDIKPSNR